MPERMEIEKTTDNMELIRQAQAGDRAAMEKLISQNMGLVKNVAKRFIGRNAEYEDLVQIGTIGMLKDLPDRWAMESNEAEYLRSETTLQALGSTLHVLKKYVQGFYFLIKQIFNKSCDKWKFIVSY